MWDAGIWVCNLVEELGILPLEMEGMVLLLQTPKTNKQYSSIFKFLRKDQFQSGELAPKCQESQLELLESE